MPMQMCPSLLWTSKNQKMHIWNLVAHASSWSLWSLQEKLVPQKMTEIKIQHRGNVAILTSISKYICMKLKVFHLCKYKTQGLTFVVFHHHFCKGLLNQNMQWLQTLGPTIFFPCCRLWFISKNLAINFLVSYNFIFVIKWGCAYSICVFIRIMLFVLLYLMHFFFLMELSWFGMLLIVWLD
jgi:hypothetical protein